MAELTITEGNFEAEVLKSDKPVLLDFWATWCGPCLMLSPVVAAVAEEKAGVLKVGKVNVDQEQKLAAMFGISSIPLLVMMKGGKPVATLLGYHPKSQVDDFVNEHLK